ncbi:sigma-70 family RNA polymerase sigma factor [Microbacterium marinilacus]|uniref:sigma-70 family RNA polymerase sigma factor n=1 Tax=Microbacterium marinilacus TaxID=415209 RepID=UPI0027E03EB1|nr:sigma-70 family RNA polymerase sigma factor [Microbacterium marinilacus]
MPAAPTAAARAWRDERDRLVGIAYRMLGDFGHAEDVVSEVAIEALRAEPSGEVRSWPAWLTTTCVRRSIDRLRQLASAREEYPGPWLPEPVATDRLPEDVVAGRELLSITMLHLAEQLAPDARAAVVLHRAFGMSSVEIGAVLGRTPAAVRQLVSRAERKLGLDEHASIDPAADTAALDRIVTALERGDVAGVLALLDDDAVLWTDGGGRVRAALNPIFGRERISRFFVGIVESAVAAVPDAPISAAAIAVNGQAALSLTVAGVGSVIVVEHAPSGAIRGVRMIRNPDKLMRAL